MTHPDVPPPCPAATGPAKCDMSTDNAHRCTYSASHMTAETGDEPGRRTHRCACGTRWTSLIGGVAELMDMML